MILLIISSYNIQSSENSDIIKYIVENDYHSLKILLENGADIEQTDYINQTPLLINLSLNINTEITQLLLSYGANINAQDKNKFTPLYYAVLNEDINLIKYLLEKDVFLLIALLFFSNKKIIIFLPFIFIILLQLKYGHNMITWEEWENFNLYNIFKSHDYSTFFNLITINHISHNILIPRIIITVISSIFGFYPLILMITATIFHFLSLILIFKKNEFEKMPALYLFVISMFFFSLRQIENFFWGFQIAFLFCNLSSISCFYFTDNYLKSNKTADLIKASIFAIVASFSSLMGILCFIPLLYSQFKNRTRTIYFNGL